LQDVRPNVRGSLVMLLTLASGAVLAQEAPAYNPAARAMVRDAAAWDALLKGDILVETVPVPGSNIPRAVLHAVIEAPPARIWAVVSDCSNYKKNMPRIAESQQLKREGDDVTCRIVADMPFPLSNTTNISRAHHTVADGVYKREWKMVEGDYKSNEGSWVVAPLDPAGTRSLVVYTIHIVPTTPVPGFMMAMGTKQTLPGMIHGLRKQMK